MTTHNTPDDSHSDGSRSRFAFWKKQVITRGDNAPYMTRLIVFRCPWFAIYLHKFVGDDDLCLHDHPWPFLSLILWGGYYETDKNKVRTWYSAGSILFRRAEWRHRVELDRGRPCYTLVVIGKKCRHWGFWTSRGWIPWRQYIAQEHCSD